MSIAAGNSINSRVPRRQVGEERNNYLTQHAGSLLQQGGNEDTIYKELTIINKEDCTPPLPSKEVARIARSISTYAQRRSHEGGTA